MVLHGPLIGFLNTTLSTSDSPEQRVYTFSIFSTVFAYDVVAIWSCTSCNTSGEGGGADGVFSDGGVNSKPVWLSSFIIGGSNILPSDSSFIIGASEILSSDSSFWPPWIIISCGTFWFAAGKKSWAGTCSLWCREENL